MLGLILGGLETRRTAKSGIFRNLKSQLIWLLLTTRGFTLLWPPLRSLSDAWVLLSRDLRCDHTSPPCSLLTPRFCDVQRTPIYLPILNLMVALYLNPFTSQPRSPNCGCFLLWSAGGYAFLVGILMCRLRLHFHLLDDVLAPSYFKILGVTGTPGITPIRYWLIRVY